MQKLVIKKQLFFSRLKRLKYVFSFIKWVRFNFNSRLIFSLFLFLKMKIITSKIFFFFCDILQKDYPEGLLLDIMIFLQLIDFCFVFTKYIFWFKNHIKLLIYAKTDAIDTFHVLRTNDLNLHPKKL